MEIQSINSNGRKSNNNIVMISEEAYNNFVETIVWGKGLRKRLLLIKK